MLFTVVIYMLNVTCGTIARKTELFFADSYAHAQQVALAMCCRRQRYSDNIYTYTNLQEV